VEIIDINKSNESVEFFLSVFRFVFFAFQSNTDSSGDVSDTIVPQMEIDRGVNTDIAGTHSLLGEFTDDLDGLRGTFLEGSGVDSTMNIDGIFTRNLKLGVFLDHEE